jgi:GNAT superfamily N-acetyltransferase
MTFHFRDLKSGDKNDVAVLHSRTFKNFFLTSLGLNFLRSFYDAIIRRKDAISRGSFDESGKLVGFYVANMAHQGFYKRLAKENFLSLSFASLPAFLLNPFLLLRLMKSFGSDERLNKFAKFPYLLSICVSPEVQGQGVGKALIDDLTEILKAQGFQGLFLTTDSNANDATNAFYINKGFIPSEQFFQGKRAMTLYFKSIA